MKRILFISPSFIGDTVLALSVMNHITHQWPAAQITVATPPGPIPLYEAIPQVNRVWTLQKKGWLRHWLKLWQQAILTPWDLICDLRGSGLSFFLLAKKRLAWYTPNNSLHRIEQLRQWWQQKMPLPAAHHFQPKIWITPEDSAAVARLPISPILFAPAATWPEKQWPAQKFIQLYQQLQEQGIKNPLLLVASATEHRLCQTIALQIPGALNVAGQLTLRQIAALFARGALFVGNDSGLMHMAAAMECPTIGLFGPSREENYAPYGSQVWVVRTPETYEDLWHRIHSPSYQQGTAMKNLSIEKVAMACQALLFPKSSQINKKVHG